MIAHFRAGVAGIRSPKVAGGLFVALMGAIGAYAAVTLAGTKTGAVLAAVCVFGPALIYAAIIAPFTFPFMPFIAVVPFDNLLGMPAFGSITRILAIACGAAFLFYLLRTRKAVPTPQLMMIWLAYLLWMLASTLWAIDSQASFDLLPTEIQLFGLYFIVSFMPVKNTQLQRIITTIVLTFTGAAAYGAYLFHSGAAVGAGGRLWISNDNAMIDPNHFAAAMLLPTALAIVGVLVSTRWTARALYILALLVLLIGFGIAGSRGGMLGLLAIVAYLFYRLPYRRQFTIVFIVMAVLALPFLPQLFAHFQQGFETGGSGRMAIWKVGWHAFTQYWLTGAGYGNFPQAYDQSFISVPERYYSNWHRRPHDLLIGTSVELGIIGTGLLLSAWFGQFSLLKHIGRDHRLFGVRTAAEATLIGLFVAALFLDIMTMKYAWLVFIFVLLVRNASFERIVHAPTPVSPVLPSLHR
jgi:O-antigen ligase